MQEDPGRRLVEIADELRGVAQNGLFWTERTHDEYGLARYEKAMELAAQILSLADNRGAEEIERIFRGELGIRSPFVGVTAALFDEEGRILLTQRKDNRKWCMPGGLADVGEPPSKVAVRETWEETGLRVKPVKLIGVFDSRKSGSLVPVHLYHLDFLCQKVGGQLTLTNETIDYGYFEEEKIASLDMHGSHAHRVPHAFQAHRTDTWEALFQ
ncbi:MAG: NUDIX hydrolase N-terminal domain-containing protein [Chloroflexia bacterium]